MYYFSTLPWLETIKSDTVLPHAIQSLTAKTVLHIDSFVYSVMFSVHFFRDLPFCHLPSTDSRSTLFTSQSSVIWQICPHGNNFLGWVIL